MPRIWSRIVLSAIALTTLVIAILLATDFGAPDGGCSSKPLQYFLPCLLRSYQDLAGGLIGGVGTIFAAILAWLAIRRQMAHDQELATSGEREAMEAVRSDLRAAFEVINQVWRALDLAVAPGQPAPRAKNSAVIARVTLDTLPPVSFLEKVEEYVRLLGPVKRRQYSHVRDALRWFYNELEAQKGPARRQLEEQMQFQFLRTHLSHMERYLRAFDPQLTDIFRERNKVDVNHDGMAVSVARFIDSQPN